MFTGIITEIGKVKKVQKEKSFIIEIIGPKTVKDKNLGQSIAVNGVCVTITKISKDSFEFEAIPETLEQSNLKSLQEGDEVNLEAAMTLNQGLDGYLVQGHIDSKGKVLDFSQKEKATLTIEFPEEISRYLAFKGSITVNGVNLTVSELQENFFRVDLTQFTLENTTLKNLKKDDMVNLETDIIAKYLENLLNHKEKETKFQFLKDRNLI